MKRERRAQRKSRTRQSAHIVKAQSGGSEASDRMTEYSTKSAHWGCTFVGGATINSQQDDDQFDVNEEHREKKTKHKKERRHRQDGVEMTEVTTNRSTAFGA